MVVFTPSGAITGVAAIHTPAPGSAEMCDSTCPVAGFGGGNQTPRRDHGPSIADALSPECRDLRVADVRRCGVAESMYDSGLPDKR